MTQTRNFWVFVLSPRTSTRSATWDLDSQRRGPRLAAPWTLTSSTQDLDSQRQGTNDGGPRLAAAWTSTEGTL